MAKTIILIDDDQDDLDIMRGAIKQLDDSALCISFVYPEEAVRVVTNELIFIPNFVFIDINMPGLTGDKVLQEFRKNKMLNNAIITMFSTSLPSSVAEVLQKKGANFTFEKPTKAKDYYQVISDIFSSAESQ